tara:strand:- start:160 stop:501 length:342 start_codon:yes stop_codon:yes gene_type:complete
MEKRNRYRNRIRMVTLCRLVLAAALLLAAGAGFVLVRNEHVIRGYDIRDLEDEVVELEREIEMWELRIAGVKGRQELSRRLRWVQSDLQEIELKRVIEVDGTEIGNGVVASLD